MKLILSHVPTLNNLTYDLNKIFMISDVTLDIPLFYFHIWDCQDATLGKLGQGSVFIWELFSLLSNFLNM